MANIQTSPVDIGFVNSLKAVSGLGGSGANLTTPLNYTSITAMRARLTVINAAYYTSSMLDKMNVNDMVFALRTEDDPKTIADYMP